MTNTFSERLKSAMFDAGLNQNMLAQAIGVSAGAISMYLHGSIKPGHDRLKALAEATGVTAEYLATGDDNGHISTVPDRISLTAAARCLRMSPTTVRDGMLNGDLPIGHIIVRPGKRNVVLITPEKLRDAAGAARFQQFFGG